MPRSNGRPINRLTRDAREARNERIFGPNPLLREIVSRVRSLRTKDAAQTRSQRLDDRRDYRQSLIHRIANANGERKGALECRLAIVERQIGELK